MAPSSPSTGSARAPTVIVISGANCDRATKRRLAEHLAEHFTVLNYDRRGRGDSGDTTTPYAVEREIEDLRALLDELGGSGSVYGHSSGAALAVHAAAHGVPIQRDTTGPGPAVAPRALVGGAGGDRAHTGI